MLHLSVGLIANVNRSIQASDVAIELYYLNHQYGYSSSGLVCTALNRLLPARADDFARQLMIAKECLDRDR